MMPKAALFGFLATAPTTSSVISLQGLRRLMTAMAAEPVL